MSRLALKGIQAAAGGASAPVYVDDVFSTFLYKGAGSTTINNGIDLAGEGGLVWGKTRSNTFNYQLIDTERGVRKVLSSNKTTAYGSAAELTNGDLSAFNSNGFSLTGVASGGNNLMTSNGQDFLAWTFRKQPGFFDIVTYTGDGTQNRAVPHNLGTTPGMILIKSRDVSRGWVVWHRSINAAWTGNKTAGNVSGGNDVGKLDLDTSAFSSGYGGFTYVDDTAFGLYFGNQDENVNGEKYVAYIFAHDAQDFGTDSDEAIIKCGSYTGNGNSNGPTIDLGFEPQWLLFKKTTGSAEEWIIHDNMRGMPVGGNDAELLPASSSIEYSSYAVIDVTATGFKITHTSARYNENGQTYLYMAIRRPHKPASEFAATELFTVVNGDGTGAPSFKGVLTDFKINTTPASSQDKFIGSRLQGARTFRTNDTSAEGNSSSSTYDFMNGWSGSTGLDSSWISWMWRRAPGFFDVVTYTGNQTARQIPHNLGVVPELMIVKCRSQVRNWAVYAASQGNTKVNPLDLNAFSADTSSWNNTSPTSTHFTVGDSATTNFNPEPMVAYLFASVPGISKIGSYTATGSNINVDCGFTNGARFVLIKWANDVSDWYLWDSVRGIVAGSDPYLRLNKTNAETTTTDWIDPLSSGFTVTSAAGNDVNYSGGTYIFYAIA